MTEHTAMRGEEVYDQELDLTGVVRQIDGVLDLGWVHKELAPYSHGEQSAVELPAGSAVPRCADRD